MLDDLAGAPPENGPETERKPYRCWHMVTPFRKDGSPVMGSFGKSMDGVIIMRAETFKRLVAEHPTLADALFEIGS